MSRVLHREKSHSFTATPLYDVMDIWQLPMLHPALVPQIRTSHHAPLLNVRFYEKGSSFKHALFRIDKKTSLVAAQIAGHFTLPQDPQQKLAFLAGSIGITPFRSMLKYLLDTQQRRDIVLFYANKTAYEIVYTDVLNAAQAKLGIKTFYTLRDISAIPRTWTG